jgi:hypothetical protein
MSFGIIIDAKKKKSSRSVPLDADPNFRHVKKIGKEILSMKRCGERRERIDRELGSEVYKYTKVR